MRSAIVLAGGEARRLGGVSKPDVTVGGRRMLEIVLDALAGVDRVVVVTDEGVAVPDGVLRTLEDPPLGGPTAGIAAGLAALDAAAPDGAGARAGTAPAGGTDDEVLILACDLPGAEAIVTALQDAGSLPDDADGVLLARPDGRREWLAARLRTASLRRAVAGLGSVRDVAVRRLLDRLTLVTAPAPGDLADDVDTWADRRTWEERAVGRRRRRPPVTEQDDWETVLAPWLAAAASELGLRSDVVDVDAVHEMCADVAQTVQRSMVPVAAYLAGVAVGRGTSFDDAVAAVGRSLPTEPGA